MIKFQIPLVPAFLALAIYSEARPRLPDEIRYARMEEYGRIVSMLILRPDTIQFHKYLSHPKDGGDTIGIYGAGFTQAGFDSVWALLESGKAVGGLRPDSKVVTIHARKQGKEKEFSVPIRPPMPEWASNFMEKIGDLNARVYSKPLRGLSLKIIPPLKGSWKNTDTILVENPGRTASRLSGFCTLVLQGRLSAAEANAMQGARWISMDSARIPSRLEIPANGAHPIVFSPKRIEKGIFALRGLMACDRGGLWTEESVRSEVYSPVIQINPD